MSRSWKPRFTVLLSASFILLLVAQSASAGTSVALHPADVGWYDSTGWHVSWAQNYLVGNAEGGTYRNYFTFDLSSVPASGDEITKATLSIPNGLGKGGLQTYTLYDVSTAAVTLDTDHAQGDQAGQDIYADLGSGTALGSLLVTDPKMSPVVVSLNESGLVSLNAKREGLWSVGGDYGDVLSTYLFPNSQLYADGVTLKLMIGPFSTLGLKAKRRVPAGSRVKVSGQLVSTPAMPSCADPQTLAVTAGSKSFDTMTEIGGAFTFRVKIVRKTKVSVAFAGTADCAPVTETKTIAAT